MLLFAWRRRSRSRGRAGAIRGGQGRLDDAATSRQQVLLLAGTCATAAAPSSPQPVWLVGARIAAGRGRALGKPGQAFAPPQHRTLHSRNPRALIGSGLLIAHLNKTYRSQRGGAGLVSIRFSVFLAGNLAAYLAAPVRQGLVAEVGAARSPCGPRSRGSASRPGSGGSGSLQPGQSPRSMGRLPPSRRSPPLRDARSAPGTAVVTRLRWLLWLRWLRWAGAAG